MQWLKMGSEGLNLAEFHYQLPNDQIAKFPLANRSDSKLLYYHSGTVDHRHFYNLPDLLPKDSLLVFNDTKVIPARIILHKETGARIEVFLLEPRSPSNIHEEVMASKQECTWHVMIGNAKKWKQDQPLHLTIDGLILTATRTSQDEVSFTWNRELSFSEVLLKIGEIPLPPYLGRSVTEDDKPRYQTVYSKAEGAVAAPTAGLHFTDEILDELQIKGIRTDYLTLHVSAGTFQPIKADRIEDHPMHREQVVVRRQNVLKLLDSDQVIPVGTTSMRTLESLYWYGQLLKTNPGSTFFIKKDTPYTMGNSVSRQESLNLVLAEMDKRQTDTLIGQTEIFIYPGYEFKICKGLITNFHLPGSTLILLVAALIGPDWKKVYDEALKNNYRFLSYGDSSLLMP